GGTMKALTFFIQLREPLLMAKAQNDEPNSSSTELFIPGSAIRGALIGKHLDQPEKRGIDLLQDADAKRLFFSNEVFFLNAYLAHVPSRTRLLPRPLSWFVKKDDRHKRDAATFDFAVALNEEVESPKTPKTGEFVYYAEEKIFLASPTTKTLVHNLSRNRNRKGETISNVFRYDSLAEGQWFAGAIISENEADIKTLQKFLETGDFKFGGSHTGGYGWVHITEVNLQNDWNEHEAHQAEEDETESPKLIVTLLSDTIVRGDNGQINGNFDEGLAIALEQKPGTVRHEKAYQEHRFVGGFNRKWGLPLPQALAIKAGSVFVYDATKIKYDDLKGVIERGLGERRNEGFGRIAVNWHARKSWKQAEFKAEASNERFELRAGSESFKLAERMAENRLREKLDWKLIWLISHIDWKKEETNLQKLSPAQLSHMRLAAKQAFNKKDLRIIASRVKQIKELKNASERWGRVRLDEERLLDWITKWTSLPEADFMRAFDLRQDSLPQVAGVQAELSENLRREYCARVIDGAIKKAIKELQKREEGDEQ
ncbi:MAG: hypothetical protein ACRENG_16055, partial [bacterium]